MSWTGNPVIPPKAVGWWVNPTPPIGAIHQETWVAQHFIRISSLMAATAVLLSPAIVSEKQFVAPIMAAQCVALAPTVSTSISVNVTSPIMLANATIGAQTVVAEKKVAATVSAANATMPIPAVAHTAFLSVIAPTALVTAQTPTPAVVYGALYAFTAAGAFDFVIPNEFAMFDLIGLGGGNGGTGGGASYVNGGGGAAGTFNYRTIERDSTVGVYKIGLNRRHLFGSVGGGGAGGGCNLVPGAAGGTTTFSAFVEDGFSFGSLDAAGGVGNYGWNDWVGRGPYTLSYNGIDYVGGANQAGGFAWGGNFPGGGAAGGAGGLFGCATGANAGAGGEAWVYAYTKTGFVPPTRVDVPAKPNANATMPVPTVVATKNMNSPVAAANATMPTPYVSTGVVFDAVGAGIVGLIYNNGGTLSENHTLAGDSNTLLVFATLQYRTGFVPTVTCGGVAMTEVGYINYYYINPWYITTWIFKLKDPPTGTRAIVLTAAGGSGTEVYSTFNSVSYKGVANVSAQQTNAGNGSPTFAMTNTPTGGMAAMAFGGTNSAISAFNKSQRYIQQWGSNSNQPEIIGDAVGTGGTVTFTATHPNYWGAIGVLLS